MSEANKNDTRYIVSIGRFRSEQAAVARRKAALDNGLTCEIIDVHEGSEIDIYTVLLLIAEQKKATGDAISAMNETISCMKEALISMIETNEKVSEPKRVNEVKEQTKSSQMLGTNYLAIPCTEVWTVPDKWRNANETKEDNANV